MSPMHLNVSTLSNPNSLCIPLVSPLVCTLDYLQSIPIWTLVDSRSMYCFLDSAFARRHSLPTTSTPPVELCLFDRTSNNIISEVVLLSVKFPSGKCMTLDFYITLLDSCCSLVLGHSCFWVNIFSTTIFTSKSSFCFSCWNLGKPSVLSSKKPSAVHPIWDIFV